GARYLRVVNEKTEQRRLLFLDERHRAMRQQPLFIGSHPDCDLVLDDPEVEAWHASYHMADGIHDPLRVLTRKVKVFPSEIAVRVFHAGQEGRVGRHPLHIWPFRIETHVQPEPGEVARPVPLRQPGRTTQLEAAAARVRLRVEDVRGGGGSEVL